MKKLFALPLAVVFVAACSESTAPESVADLSPSYAKPTQPPSEICSGGACLTNDTYNFEGGVIVAGAGSSIATDLEAGGAGTADVPSVVTAPNGQKFVGRFTNVDTQLLVNVTNGGSTYSLTFDVYTIGSWDGKGRQAQQGTFLANIFSIAYRCSGNVTGTVFATTFSNQLTVQQDYPLDISAGGGAKAGTGSYAKDALGYRGDPSSNTPLFRSFGDVEYTLRLSGANPCGSGNPVTFILSTSNPSQQSVYDESWGVDNITVKSKA